MAPPAHEATLLPNALERATSAHIGDRFASPGGDEGRRRSEVLLERKLAERGIAHHTCLQCGFGSATTPRALRLTQLPKTFWALLPMAVPIPVLFPVVGLTWLLGRKRADVLLPLCAKCADEHRRGSRRRRVTGATTVVTAMSAPPLIVLLESHHVPVAAAWLTLMLIMLAGLVWGRSTTEGQVLECASIDGDTVKLLGRGSWYRQADDLPEGVEVRPSR